jgi:acetyltransferase-like isoleucine patch superfamily enzyme
MTSTGDSLYRRAVRPVLVVAYEAIMQLLFCLPRFRTLNRLKAAFLRLNGAKVGRRVVFYPGVWIAPGANLVLGDDVDLARGVLITTRGGVTIGDRVLVGYNSMILSTNHRIPDGHGRIFGAGHDLKAVSIGDDAWIGAHVVIVPGVSIGNGAVVAAGSVVTKDVEPFTVVGGVPARLLSRRR